MEEIEKKITSIKLTNYEKSELLKKAHRNGINNLNAYIVYIAKAKEVKIIY